MKKHSAMLAIGAALLLAGFGSTRATVSTAGDLVPGPAPAMATDSGDASFGFPECEGCTPGFWKNHLAAWAPTGYSPWDVWDTVFGVQVFGSSFTLLDALNQGGGGINALARASTAGLLNMAHPDVDYCCPSQATLIADVKKAILLGMPGPMARRLDRMNNEGCPLN